MMKQKNDRRPKGITAFKERGSVLIGCLVVLLAVTLIGLISLHTTDFEVRDAGKRKAGLNAFFAAESGLAEAMKRLNQAPSSADYLGDSAAPLDPDWSAYLLTSGEWLFPDDPRYDGSLTNYIPTSADPTNTIVEANSKQSGIDYFVRIRHKREYDAELAGHTVSYPHYLDGDSVTLSNSDASRGGIIHYGYGDSIHPTVAMQFTTSTSPAHQPVEIVTAYGISGDNLSVVEAEVVRDPGVKVLSAIYTEGDFTGNGNSATISGVDQCGQSSDLAAIYNLDPATTSVHGGTIDGTVEQGSDDLDLGTYIEAMLNTSGPLLTLTSDVNNETYGAPGAPVTVYSETSGNVGGLRMSNIDGYGNLIIEGGLTLGGGFTWTGLVVVKGTLELSGGGSGVNIIGAVMADETVTLNGGLEIYYDSCAVENAKSALGYKMINWRQL